MAHIGHFDGFRQYIIKRERDTGPGSHRVAGKVRAIELLNKLRKDDP